MLTPDEAMKRYTDEAAKLDTIINKAKGHKFTLWRNYLAACAEYRAAKPDRNIEFREQRAREKAEREALKAAERSKKQAIRDEKAQMVERKRRFKVMQIIERDEMDMAHWPLTTTCDPKTGRQLTKDELYQLWVSIGKV